MKKLKIESNFRNSESFNFKSSFKALFCPEYADSAFIWDSVEKHETMSAYYRRHSKDPKPAQKIIFKVMVCGVEWL